VIGGQLGAEWNTFVERANDSPQSLIELLERFRDFFGRHTEVRAYPDLHSLSSPGLPPKAPTDFRSGTSKPRIVSLCQLRAASTLGSTRARASRTINKPSISTLGKEGGNLQRRRPQRAPRS
jgi:hypothetical protein